MNAKYIRLRATAERLIRENGAKIQLKKVSENIDPVTGLPVGPAELTQDIYAVILPLPGSTDSATDHFINNNGILDLSKLKKVIVSTQGLQWVPETGQLVQYDGEWWNFYGSGKLDPDGQVIIMYKGFIRRT